MEIIELYKIFILLNTAVMIYVICLCVFKEGNKEKNKYGPSPKFSRKQSITATKR